MAAPTFNQLQQHYNSYDAFADSLVDEGASDGLPLVPPTPAMVRACLEAAGLEPSDILGTVPTREAVLDAERAAINAVMAGCKSEYFPVVAAAVRAWCHPKANAHGTTATLAGAAHPIIVNGPVRQELGIACKEGCFGPGTRANATIGRALRLVMRNMAWAIPGFSDRAAYSQPSRYSFCFGEDEEGSTWAPLHVERGWDSDANVVTVHSMTDCFVLRDTVSVDPRDLLNRVASLARSRPLHVDEFVGKDRSIVIVFGPEHRELLTSAGWSKHDVRAYLHPVLTAHHTFPTNNEREVWGGQTTGGIGEYDHFLPHSENIHLVGAGGAGLSVTYVLYPHQASSISCEVTYDGSAGHLEPLNVD